MPLTKTDLPQITERALTLFRRQGYHRTTMAELAAACGLLKGSLYHHTPSKEALARAAMGHVHAAFRAEIFALAYEDRPLAECADRMVDALRRSFLGRDDGCLMGNLVLELIDAVPDFRPALEAYFADWIASLKHLFRRAALSERDALAQAQDTLAAIQGGLLLLRVFKDPQPFLRATAAIAAIARTSQSQSHKESPDGPATPSPAPV